MAPKSRAERYASRPVAPKPVTKKKKSRKQDVAEPSASAEPESPIIIKEVPAPPPTVASEEVIAEVSLQQKDARPEAPPEESVSRTQVIDAILDEIEQEALEEIRLHEIAQAEERALVQAEGSEKADVEEALEKGNDEVGEENGDESEAARNKKTERAAEELEEEMRREDDEEMRKRKRKDKGEKRKLKKRFKSEKKSASAEEKQEIGKELGEPSKGAETEDEIEAAWLEVENIGRPSEAEVWGRAELMKSKQVLQEIQLPLTDDALPPNVLQQIRERKWEKLVCPVEASRLRWVREFYAGRFNQGVQKSVIAGKIVCWDAAVWEEVLSLPEVEGQEVEEMITSPSKEQLAQCLAAIAKPGARWENEDGTCSIFTANLLPEASLWRQVVHTSLMPSTHESTLTRSRALLIFAIMSGKPIDLGALIARELRKRMDIKWDAKSGKLFFPRLICALCRFKGVAVRASDEIIPRPKPLKLAIEPKVKKGKGGVGVASGVNDLFEKVEELRLQHEAFRIDMMSFMGYVHKSFIALASAPAGKKAKLPAFPNALRKGSVPDDASASTPHA